MAGEGDADLGFAADDEFAGDVVGHAVEGAGERERPECISSVAGGAAAGAEDESGEVEVETWDAIRSRRNVRSYGQGAIAPQDLDQILEAARRTPSAGNQQAWDLVVCTDRQQLAQLAKVGPPPATSPARRRRSRWWPRPPTTPSCATWSSSIWVR
jgi:hypothetical protein